MVRRSTGQKYNLSQDMIAETVHQANHFFSFPTSPSAKPPTKMILNLSYLPQETIDKYDLIEMTRYGKVYIETQKGMYGLPQAGILANEFLQRNLAKDGRRPTKHTHGLWKHDTGPLSFSLVVEYFGVKYVGREHAEHLMECIKNIVTFPATGKAVHTVA
jgi:hypothetical protein